MIEMIKSLISSVYKWDCTFTETDEPKRSDFGHIV